MDRDRVRRVAQLVLVGVAVVSAAAAGWRFLDSRGPASVFGTEKAVEAVPGSGPVGMHPILETSGWARGATVTVFFCLPTSRNESDGCVELAKVAGGRTPSERAGAIPASIGGAPVEPETYLLRAGTGGADDPYAVRGRFQVTPFEIGSRPDARTFPKGAAVTVSAPRDFASGASCSVSVTPDGRVLVSRRLVDVRNGVITDLRADGAELVWSPARDRLAVVTSDRKEIRLAGPDGGAPETVVREARGFLSSVTFSPEGDRFAYIARSDPSTRGGPGPPTVRIFNLTSGPAGTAGPGERVAWSPKEDKLAVEAGGQVQLSDLAGARTPLGPGIKPAWSPDGSFVAVVRPGAGEAGEAWVMRAEAPQPARLLPDTVCGLAFSADGARLVVAVPAGQGATLQVRDLKVTSRSG